MNKTSEWIIQRFNKQFRDTSWYPDNWEAIEQFLLEAVEEARRETIEEVLSLVQIPASESRTEKVYLVSVSDIERLKISKLEGGKNG